MKQCLSNFDSVPLTCNPALFPGKNIPNIAKNNRVFPEREKGEKEFILTYFDISMADVFSTAAYWPSSGGKEESKLDQKC